MKAARVGSRGHLFRFDDPYETYTYAIVSEMRIYICDTYVGPEPMTQVREYLESICNREREVIVFNSHADYDHHWGNCFFKDAVVIGHELCQKRVVEEGMRSLEMHAADRRGEVVIIPPHITFAYELEYAKDGVRFYHTPGHTEESSSCFDRVDGVLFVGDNLEYPIPYVNDLHFDRFIATLRAYAELDWNAIVTGHSGMHADRILLNQNIKYLEALRAWRISPADITEQELNIHSLNLVTLCRHLEGLPRNPVIVAHYRAVIEALRAADRVSEYSGVLERLERFLTRSK